MSDPIASGDYARKQIHCPNSVVRWSHGSRFRLAATLASAARGGTILDYGCGDGTFIGLTHGTFRAATGTDVDASQLAECARRLGHLATVSFVPMSEVAGPYDVVTCMEVLEHCTDSERRRVIRELARVCGPAGRVIISVPIEIGPSLLGKQLFRAIAAVRGQGDYAHRETYSGRELLRAVFARPHLERPVYLASRPDGDVPYCGHKGFDWRILERELQTALEIQERRFTPMPLTGPLLNSQVWFVCTPKR